jgi:citrate lyase subunit beta/citryl-CoA lyase
VDDVVGLRAWADAAHRMGFEGLGCIHPRQVRVIHEAFTPPEAEVARAAAVIDAYRAARSASQGVVALAGVMIDPPVVARARRTLHLARASGHTPGTKLA